MCKVIEDMRNETETKRIVIDIKNDLLSEKTLDAGYSDAAKPPIRRNGNRLSGGRKPQSLLMRRSRLSGVA